MTLHHSHVFIPLSPATPGIRNHAEHSSERTLEVKGKWGIELKGFQGHGIKTKEMSPVRIQKGTITKF